MQNPFGGRQPVGIVYNTPMDRPDAALALSLLLQMEGRREARTAALAVTGAGLAAAVYCDILIHFYFGGGAAGGGGQVPNSNRLLPVGLTVGTPMAADAAFVKAIVERRKDGANEPLYARAVRRVADTAEVPALLRNALTGMQDGNVVFVLSGPATGLARSLELPGTAEMAGKKIKTLVVSDGAPQRDGAALRTVLARWTGPVVLCPRSLGEQLQLRAAEVEKGFAWAERHPAMDLYREFRAMPYDAPGWDVAAMLYAIKPDAGLFALSDGGEIRVADDGVLTWQTAANGKHRVMRVAEGKSDSALAAMLEAATAKPAPRVSPFRRQQAADAAKPAEKK